MASELPLWYGRERGVDLIGFADIGDGGDADEPDNDSVSGSVLGTIVIGLLLGAGVAGIATVGTPLILAVLAGIASAAIVGWCFAAIAQVSTSEDASALAQATVATTDVIGEAAKLTVIILAFAVGIAFVLVLIGALSSDRR